jgi:phospholipase C
MRFSQRWQHTGVIVMAVTTAVVLGAWVRASGAGSTTTPLEHLIVIFQENVSFDHYFATYPHAANPPNEPVFEAKPGTPSVNGLTGSLLTHNPNASPPFRLSRSQANTCDQNHEYLAEQQAFNAGLMDQFVEFTGVGSTAANPCADYGFGASLVMGYFDGNTVTALWNYAQHFAMSDNSFNTVFGPSTPGHLNLIAGQTHGALDGGTGDISGEVVDGSVIGDPQPFFDDCSTRETVQMTGKNVGDLLNAKGVTWGWFQGGFTPSSTNPVKCDTAHTGSDGKSTKDYVPHHQPFQYYASTANPHHLPPLSVEMIGHSDQANHQYDLSDFWAAAESGNMPAVSFLKAPAYQDGHAGYSDPLAEQTFLVQTLNRLQRLTEWEHAAVIIAYDDSDGWHDHVMGPIVSQSSTSEDGLTGAGSCGTAAPGAYQGRCGYGPRLPLLVSSPFAKVNFVDHSVTDQASILRFIEDNWELGRLGDQSFDETAGSLLNLFTFSAHRRAPPLFLDPATGQVLTP